MKQDSNASVKKSRKRKSSENVEDAICLDDLNQDLMEKVLSWLPTSNFFRLRSVCKRWNSMTNSPTLRLACSQIPYREPWFYMVDLHMNQSVVFDTAEMKWKNINYPNLLQQNQNSPSVPVAAAGGLVCFRTVSGDFQIFNPVSGTCRQLPPTTIGCQPLQAVAMKYFKQQLAYKIILVSGNFPNFTAQFYDSLKDIWEDEFVLSKKMENLIEMDTSNDEIMFFLSKSGDVVSTNMQRSLSKQYSAVITEDNGDDIVYFLSLSGTVVGCNLSSRLSFEYPRLLPIFYEYSIDLVECGGRMLAVVLYEFLESASLRIWMYSNANHSWHQIAQMPPSMSNNFFGKKADINCVGCGDLLMICINFGEISSQVLCNLQENSWIELPKCHIHARNMEFVSVFSFQPRIEATV